MAEDSLRVEGSHPDTDTHVVHLREGQGRMRGKEDRMDEQAGHDRTEAEGKAEAGRQEQGYQDAPDELRTST